MTWFRAGADALCATLSNASEDLDCFTFFEAPSPLLFWARRQAHETAIHRVDAETVSGEISAFPAELAADGIDELFTGFWGNDGAGPRAAQQSSVAVKPEDAPLGWTVTVDPEAVQVQRTVTQADATVSGRASDLYVWCWNRPGVNAVSFDADRDTAEVLTTGV